MDDYKLSHTAQEVDELLTRVKGGGGLCVETIETLIPPNLTGQETVALSANDNAILNKYASSGMAFIVKITIGPGYEGATYSGLMTYVQFNNADLQYLVGEHTYLFGMLGGSSYLFMCHDGAWSVGFDPAV